jgi:hypothetical protein
MAHIYIRKTKMAQFTRVNGDLKQVFHFDANAYTNTGVNAVTSGATVQNLGPKLDFFTVTFDGGVTTTQLAQVIQSIQQLSTIHIYEYTDTTNDTLALALFPAGEYTTTTLAAAVNAVDGVAGATAAASATFTN